MSAQFIMLYDQTIINANQIVKIWFEPEWYAPWGLAGDRPQAALFLRMTSDIGEMSYSLRYEGDNATRLWNRLQTILRPDLEVQP